MISEEELLSGLDSDQKEAVMAPLDKPSCVRANAGSGKTRVLSSRVAYLVLKKVSGIMLLTFTNKAAKEMTERVQKLVGDNISTRIISGTFHHMACIFLRRYSKAVGIDNKFSILSQSDAESIISRTRKEVLSEIPKNEVPKDFPTAPKIMSKYSFYKNKFKDITFDAFLRNSNVMPKSRELIENIIKEYEIFKKESNSLDFDDLIIYFRKLILSSIKVRQSIHSAYPYILCDEYQDVNYIQKDIIDMMDINNTQMVVGDEGQSIYGWRGSNINYILSFKENHKNALIYTIRYNYRSGSGIVKLAENAINLNVEKEENKKIMIPFQKQKVIPVIKGFIDEIEQGNIIANQILSQKYDLGETAVLVRSNRLTRDLEFAFRKRHIKYKVVGGTPFYEKAHIKDLFAFLKFEYNKKDRIAFIRIITMANGIGAKTAERIYEIFRSCNFNYQFIKNFKVPKKSKDDVETIFNIMEESENIKVTAEKLKYIFKSFYENYLYDEYNDESIENRLNDVKKFIEMAEEYITIDSFIEDLILDNKNDDDKSDVVTISTVHRAKGLEWDNVFLPYLNDDVFPSNMSTTIEELQEEQRLFYVAITRAKKNLFISYIDAFSDDPKQNIQYSSKFIKQLDGRLFVAE
ncbi:ATP-dependent helicase [Clostridium felsineum]|uniref:DNA 3'-5' helicase n=1 Tax=Clostridium felsineum TaxID=36839 RepID=A0A1S8KY73_9CLOT|nr:ATP-dependent helicase [Clostridium felsineum]URZ05951.1 ATP-dependent DNA helicase PcrA [Clostridium felsineum]URZ10988.1 ATP-dependent DNA helicase PcrA [Clostridium felsineum]